MKKIITAILIIACVSYSFTSDSLKTMLLDVYSKERTSEILNDTQKKKYYTNLLFHSFKTESIPVGKPINPNLVVLNSVTYKNIDGTYTTLSPKTVVSKLKNGTFNILKAQIQRDYSATNSYVLGDTRVVLNLYSYTYLTELQKK